MIITKLQGGLGNQLFQWAISKNLSLKYDTNIYFDISYFKDNTLSRVSKWDLELSKLNINIETISTNSLPIINDNFSYQEIGDDTYLNGYWQSEKYFIENEDIIRDCLRIKPEMKTYILNKYPILLESKTTSLHIRRGDYINLQEHHPIQCIEYYNNSHNILYEDDMNFIILSNDIEWCKKNIHYKNTTFIENETNITDLYIMSLCKNNIIANSSFSWWGAWLNENKNKKIIAPKIWFGHKSIFTDVDIIPKEWIKI